MKLINYSHNILKQEDILKHVEYAGRTAYQSYDKIKDDSYKSFIETIVKNNHTSVLEHGTVYLTTNINTSNIDQVAQNSKSLFYELTSVKNSPYTKRIKVLLTDYITTNLRVIYENAPRLYQMIINGEEFPSWLEFGQKDNHIVRTTVQFIVDIGISREANRHRVNSITESSTRFCNFSLDKFDNSISFANCEQFFKFSESWLDYVETCQFIENKYMRMIERGETPQIARQILPLGTIAKLVHTAFNSDWVRFFELRTANDAHPIIQHCIIPLKEEFRERGWL